MKSIQSLGMTEDFSDEDESPASFGKDRHKLTEVERNGATVQAHKEEICNGVPEAEQPGNFPLKITRFFKGVCYILVECICLSSFYCVLNSIHSVGKIFLNDTGLNVGRIVLGLAIMQITGQTQKWVTTEEEPHGRSRRRKSVQGPALFRSVLNIFSWWTIFAGIDYFCGLFESDVIYNIAETEWYYDWCSMGWNETNANEECLADGADMTCAWNETDSGNVTKLGLLKNYLVDGSCVLMDSDGEAIGVLYRIVLCGITALTMWFVFNNNFFRMCDV